jgi:hypothetical protein
LVGKKLNAMTRRFCDRLHLIFTKNRRYDIVCLAST